MRELSITWSAETLDRYLTDPLTMVPTTYMAFTGLKRPQDRDALICYLRTLDGSSS
jgi:cytochrome c